METLTEQAENEMLHIHGSVQYEASLRHRKWFTNWMNGHNWDKYTLLKKSQHVHC